MPEQKEKVNKTVDIDLNPSQLRFIKSEAPIIFFVSSQGEGKTFSGFISAIYHYQKIGNQKVRALWVRDTHTNIKDMTVPSFNDAIEHIAKKSPANEEFIKACKWHDDYHILEHPFFEWHLVGMDSVNDVNKLMGAGYSLINLEEPAPMMTGASQGIPESVFIAGVARSARQSGITTSRLQVTMNKADEFHWTTKRMYNDPIMRPEFAPDMWTDVIEIPSGENKYLSDHARQAMRAAYALDPSLQARFIDNKIAFTPNGVPVTPEYDENIHRSNEKLSPLPGIPCYRFWDQGHDKACIICQVNPMLNRLVVLDSLVADGVGIKQLIRGVLKPLLSTRYKSITEWIDSGDPAIMAHDQGDYENGAQAIIEYELNTIFEPGVTDWQIRKQLIKRALTESPMLLLSKHELELHLALRGGWAMKKLSTGVVLDHPPKTRSSAAADAISQGLAIFFQSKEKKPKRSVSSLLEKVANLGRW